VVDPWTGRYLALLGLQPAAPDRAFLDAIIRAHRAITFENVSSLVRRHAAGDGPVPQLDLDAVMDAWVARGGGGVCYEVGSMLGRLLDDLGYVVYPVLAQISFPGSHSALMVDLDGRQLLVDVGNGQPIFEAIPADEPFEIDRAGLRYRFRLDETTGKLIQDRWVGGEFKPFVTYEMESATPDEMEASYQRHHALPPMTFVMQNFRLVHCTDDEVIQLRDGELTRYRAGGKTTEEVGSLERYRELVAGPFGFPGMDVERGLRAWSAITGGKVPG
jgi:N-hydroxyarylamine O-acetyltransferase